MSSPTSRRSFLRGAGITAVAVAGGPLLVAACGDDDDPPSAPRSVDVAVLNTALDLEHTAVAAYGAIGPSLRGAARGLGRQFLEQEQAHVAALTEAIERLGGTPNKPRAKYDHPVFSGERDALNFVNDFENTAIAAYIDALPKLTDPKLRGTLISILTTEAEHVAVWLGALNRPQAPDALVLGTP